MQLQKPVVFIITGAWHTPQHYQPVVDSLSEKGYTVKCPLLPTNNNAKPPNKILDDDVQLIRDMALEILKAGHDIVVLMHSYGGIVGTNAFAGLGASDAKTSGHVKSLIYMASFIPFENQSLAGIFGGALPPWLTPNNKGLIDIDNPGFHFYSDLSPRQQAFNVDRLVVHPSVAQAKPMKNPPKASAWRNIPVTYLFCSGDQALPVEVQEMMVGRIEKAEKGLVVKREYCAASHSPFLSMPGRVVEVVDGVCEASK